MSDKKDELARLTWEGIAGAVVLGTDFRFRAVDAEEGDVLLQVLAASADVHTADYSYSPADGQPGARLASEVGRRLKAHVDLPTPSPAEPGTVY